MEDKNQPVQALFREVIIEYNEDETTKKEIVVALEPWEFNDKKGLNLVIKSAKMGGKKSAVYLNAFEKKVRTAILNAYKFLDEKDKPKV